MTTKKSCDFVVIGTGPAGLSAALTAAKADRKVLVLEREGSVSIPGPFQARHFVR